MAVESPPWAIQSTGLTYTAEQTRRAIFSMLARTGSNSPGIIAGGLISTADCQLSAPVSGMSVNVSAGECIVGGTSGGTQGGYYARVTSQTNLAISTSDPTNPRIDTVVATVADGNYTAPSDLSGNQWALVVVTGTPTSGANLTNLSGAAGVPVSSLVLGYVLVPANATNIITADIANRAVAASLGLQAQTGTWTALTLGTSVISAAGAGGYTPSARIEGDRVRLKGVIQNNSGGTIAAGTTIFTMPSGSMNPASNALFGVVGATGGAGSASIVAVQNNGVAIINSAGPGWAANAIIPLDGMTYTLS